MKKIIEVNDLYKKYGSVEAVKGISFYVEEGSLFSFLGPNGAGKSTTIDIISTLLEKSSGEVKLGESYISKDDYEIRKKIGIVFQENLMDNILSVKENLEVRANFYFKTKEDVKKSVENALKITNITEYANRLYGKLSGGQRRRADIARALLNTPEVLILDEPTTGLDPKTRKMIWKTINKLKDDTGMTIFLTTHYMEEAANSDYIVIIDNGEIVAKGTPSQLKEKYAKDTLLLYTDNDDLVLNSLKENNFNTTLRGEAISVELSSTLDAIPIVSDFKSNLNSFEVLKGSLDDTFINITGRELK